MYWRWLLPCMLLASAIGVACGDDDTVASNANNGGSGDAGKTGLARSEGLAGHDAGGSSMAPTGGAGSGGTGSDVGGSAVGAAPAGAAGRAHGAAGAASAAGGDTGGAFGGGAGGDGGSDGFTPGLCQEIEPISPALPAPCTTSVEDSDCLACVKARACDEYAICFGQQPATACGTGMEPQLPGQFVCTTECFAANSNGAVDADALLGDCAEQCSQCPEMLLNEETIALIEAANDPQGCQAECFPFE